MPRESTIVNAIMRYLRTIPCSVAYKNHGSTMGRAGRPDIEFFHGGKAWFFEVKVPGKKATHVQRHELTRLRRAGCVAEVVTGVDMVHYILGKA